MSSVILSKIAEKEFGCLPKREQKKVFKKISLLEKDPFAGKPLSGKLKGLSSLRVWPYRIIYEFDRKKKTVFIYQIVHRQKAYK
jgi:mRNA-degrading endonuclease RelE of RelBE toxin-antitoxin system